MESLGHVWGSVVVDGRGLVTCGVIRDHVELVQKRTMIGEASCSLLLRAVEMLLSLFGIQLLQCYTQWCCT